MIQTRQRTALPDTWRTADGRELYISEMGDEHLLNANNMIERWIAKDGSTTPQYMAIRAEVVRRGLQNKPKQKPKVKWWRKLFDYWMSLLETRMPRCNERIMRFHWHIGMDEFRPIRIWWRLDDLSQYADPKVPAAIQRAIDSMKQQNPLMPIKDVISQLASIDGVNAVEVLETDLEDGLLVYPEWP